MKKRLGYGVVAAAALTGMLAACSPGGSPATSPGASAPVQNVTLSVAALEGGYGTQLYQDTARAFEALNPGVTVDLKTSKSIEDEITPNMQAGRYPDVVILGQGRKEALTETMIKDESLEDLTGVLDLTVPGENVTVRSKLIDGIVGSLSTNPYSDDRTFLMPLNYSPTGLVFDQGLFDAKGWQIPATWDDMFALGDKAKADKISLFTYPTAGYMDSYFNSLLAGVGGESFFNDVMTYKQGVWKTPQATQAIDLTTKLLTKYTASTTVGYANQQDFTKNQQTILDDKVVFMPNGTWIEGEMADAPRADHFSWGLAPLPAVQAGGDRYITTSIEAAWVPADAKQKDLAKKFVAFLYSDQVVKIFLASNAVQPVKGVSNSLPANLAGFYKVYDETGVKALVGGFASTPPVEGVDIKATLYDTANSIITGDKTAQQWLDDLDKASERLRQASA